MYNKQFWDKIYSVNPTQLPWILSPSPDVLIKKFCGFLSNKQQVLDYGCGNGRYSIELHKRGFIVDGVDISDKAIDLCKTSSEQERNLRFFQIDDLGFVKDFYDGILCWGVMHHIDPKFREQIYSGLLGLLKKNGVILLGGFSSIDCEFQGKRRISAYTGMETWPIDIDFKDRCKDIKVKLMKSSTYEYIEQPTGKLRIFNYYILRKD